MKVVLDMQDRRPIWSMPPWVPGRLREALPSDGELHVVDLPADGSGDGTARVAPEVLDAVADADAYLGFGIPEAVLERGRRLRWVHSGSAGVGGSLTPTLFRRSEVAFTNSAGIHAPPIAEGVVGALLHFARGFDLAVRGQAEGRWVQERFYEADAPVGELAGSTVGIVGYGGIGREVARRVVPVGARVLALKRTPPASPTADVPSLVDGVAFPGAVELLHGQEGFRRLLRESDAVVVCVPETEATRGLMDAGALALMKPSAVLVNVARGGVIDEEALVEALRAGRLRGAALDVFTSEPLPEDHPLWSLPRVLLTPHVSGVTRGYWTREVELIVDNLRRLREGRPLCNLVDREEGY
ncbi:MAG: D-2-hydroxyacid dehydrogenase [Gemmatimonadetes bacterium]|nr:D-2-hydroxyacid dehydrogenase [Gemmatimonadota bacterium]